MRDDSVEGSQPQGATGRWALDRRGIAQPPGAAPSGPWRARSAPSDAPTRAGTTAASLLLFSPPKLTRPLAQSSRKSPSTCCTRVLPPCSPSPSLSPAPPSTSPVSLFALLLWSCAVLLALSSPTLETAPLSLPFPLGTLLFLSAYLPPFLTSPRSLDLFFLICLARRSLP